MRVKKPTKRIRINTYIHTTSGDLNTSLMPRETTYMFVCFDGVWRLVHTFPFDNDKLVRDFVRGYLKMKKSNTIGIKIEKHIFGQGR